MAVNRKLTFVVGAGASYELGLPVGQGLLDDISKLVRKESYASKTDSFERRTFLKFADDELKAHVDQLIQKGNSSFTQSVIDAWHKEAYWIATNCSLAPSIDNLLHTHQKNSQIVGLGKLMICAALKNAELHSCLMKNQNDHLTNKFLPKGLR